MKSKGENRQLGEKPVPVPLCPPQISHGLIRDRTRASAVRDRQLTAMARPLGLCGRRKGIGTAFPPHTPVFQPHVNIIPAALHA
jgi:hypothetical protein